jgi:hypothetical protein
VANQNAFLMPTTVIVESLFSTCDDCEPPPHDASALQAYYFPQSKQNMVEFGACTRNVVKRI